MTDDLDRWWDESEGDTHNICNTVFCGSFMRCKRLCRSKLRNIQSLQESYATLRAKNRLTLCTTTVWSFQICLQSITFESTSSPVWLPEVLIRCLPNAQFCWAPLSYLKAERSNRLYIWWKVWIIQWWVKSCASTLKNWTVGGGKTKIYWLASHLSPATPKSVPLPVPAHKKLAWSDEIRNVEQQECQCQCFAWDVPLIMMSDRCPGLRCNVVDSGPNCQSCYWPHLPSRSQWPHNLIVCLRSHVQHICKHIYIPYIENLLGKDSCPPATSVASLRLCTSHPHTFIMDFRSIARSRQVPTHASARRYSKTNAMLRIRNLSWAYLVRRPYAPQIWNRSLAQGLVWKSKIDMLRHLYFSVTHQKCNV